MSSTSSLQQQDPTDPDVKLGIEYWQSVPATVNGVLGGYGLGTLPRIDALGSRSFLLSVLPRLSSVAPVTDDPISWKKIKMQERKGKGRMVTRALDAGAGVGRVSENVLTRIVDEVHLVEPVEHFLSEAANQSPKWQSLTLPPSSQPFQARKAAHFHLSTLQALDPARPWSTADGGIYSPESTREDESNAKRLKTERQPQTSRILQPTVSPADEAVDSTCQDLASQTSEPLQYDVIWCQWMLQHLSDEDLIAFLGRAKRSLVPEDGVIVVKENVCTENEDGTERVWWDEEDKSVTRSIQAYERVFKEAGLTVVKTDVQLGLPIELFVVKMWALR
ncbi:unnamed protein product [Jaminaea pallidilutea]